MKHAVRIGAAAFVPWCAWVSFVPSSKYSTSSNVLKMCFSFFFKGIDYMLPPKSSAFVFLLLAALIVPIPVQSKGLSNNEADIQETFSRIPLSFEQNLGQSDPRVKYLSRGAGYNILLTNRGAEIMLGNAHHREVISIRLAGAAKRPTLQAMEPLEQKTNYLIGNNPRQHIADIKNYGRIRYSSVYPGIDLVYYGNRQRLEYDLAVAPKADPGKIKLRFGGTHKISVTPEGDLALGDPANGIAFRKPVAYQDIGGERHPVEAEYILAANNQITFKLGKYDSNFPLVIDPILSYATYLWGTVGGIAIDSSGYIYVAGYISSDNLPVAGGYKTSQTGTLDAYVVKLSPSGTTPIYATYLGARRASTLGVGIAVDGAGNAYVTGTTDSGNYPVTAGAYQTTSPKNGGAFITKLNAAGNALAYSTFIIGATPKSIAVDGSGNAYTAGIATPAYTTTSGALQTAYRGGYVAKLNSSGSAMVYATYLGGSNPGDFCNAIAADAQGSAYVTGTTFSADFPTATPYKAFLSGSKDAFVTKLNPSGTALVYSTYLGGSGNEYGKGITVDAAGQAYAVGWTDSGDYPATAGVFQPHKGYADPSVSNAFVTKLSATGTSLIYSSYLGGPWCIRPGISSCFGMFDTGEGIDVATSVAVDAAGYAYIGGYATSSLFPLVDSIKKDNLSNSDDYGAPFVAKISPGGDRKIYSTVFSARDLDKRINGLAIDINGNVYAIGYGGSGTYDPIAPFTAGAHLTSGTSFLFKLGNGAYITSVETSANPATNAQAITFTARISSVQSGGTVTFMDGSTTLGTAPVSQGISAFTTTLSAGMHKITAVYSGDGKTSPPIYQVINSY